MKSSKAKTENGSTISLPMTHEPAPGWSTTVPPEEEAEFDRFTDLARRLVNVPKGEVDEKRQKG